MFLIFISIAVSLYIIYFILSADYRTKLSKIKSEPSLPIIGHGHKIGWNSADIIPALEKMWINTGRDKFLLKIGPTDHVALSKPEDIETVLIKHRVLKKNILYDNFKNFMGNSVFTVEPTKWVTVRKTLNPAFYVKVIESHANIYETQSKACLKEIMSKSNQNVEILQIIEKSILKVLTTAGIGLDISVDEEYINIIRKLMSVINSKVFSVWKSINFLYNFTSEGKEFSKHKSYIHEINKNALLAKRESHKELLDDLNSGKITIEALSEEEDFFKRKLGVLDLMVLSKKANGEHFNLQETIDEVLTFTVGGMETTSAAVAFALYALAKHKDIQDKVFQEQVLITNNNLTKALTFKEIKEMKYLEAVAKECLRIYSPAIFFGRKIEKDIVLADGTELPAGVNILFLPFFSHRNPSVFPDPEKFDPNRFIDNVIPPYTYYPFGVGPRDCIGKGLGLLLIKYYLAKLIRTLEFYPSPKEYNVKLAVEIMLKSTNGVHVRWRHRQV